MKVTLRISLIVVMIGCLIGGGLYAFAAPGPRTQSNPPPSHANLALRELLGVNTLVASYILPEGQDYYSIELLQFEDGKLLPRGPRSKGSVRGSERVVRVELLWAEVG